MKKYWLVSIFTSSGGGIMVIADGFTEEMNLVLSGAGLSFVYYLWAKP